MADNLPPGWEKKWNAQYRRWYYVNHSTRTTQWNAPAAVIPKSILDPADGLPAGWQKMWSAQHSRHYYVNHITKSTQWTVPKAESQAASARNSPRPSTRADSDAVKRITESDFMNVMRRYYKNSIEGQLLDYEDFQPFFTGACQYRSNLRLLKQKAANGEFDEDVDYAVAKSILDAFKDHKNGEKKAKDRAKAKEQLAGLDETLNSYEDIASEVSVEKIGKQCFSFEWEKLNAGTPIDQGDLYTCHNKIKEYCREYHNKKAQERREAEEKRQEQLSELKEMHRQLGLNASLESILSTHLPNQWRRMKSVSMGYTDMNRMKNRLKVQAKEELETKERERIRQEQQRQSEAERKRQQKQENERRQQQTEQLTKMASLFPPKYNFAANFARWMNKLKHGPLDEDDFKACLADVKKKLTAANAAASRPKTPDSAASTRKNVKKETPKVERKVKPATPTVKAVKPKKEKIKFEKKKKQREPKEHINYGSVVRLQATGSQGAGVTRIVPQGPGSAVGPASAWDRPERADRVTRVVPMGRCVDVGVKLIPVGARLAGQFEKITAVGPMASQVIDKNPAYVTSM